MSNQNNKKSSGIEDVLSNCTGKMGMDSFGCLNSSLSLFYFYFVTKLRKKIMAYIRLQLNLPPHPTRASTLLAGQSLLPSKRTYFMDDPFRERSESKNRE